MSHLTHIALFVSLASCAHTSSATSEAGSRPLSEARALEIIASQVSEQGITVSRAWSIAVSREQAMSVDLRLADGRFGVEWVSPQDRMNLQEWLPTPDEEGSLRLMPGSGDDAQVQVLVLDHSTYEFTRDREAILRGHPAAAEVESRLRRDVRDFLTYMRGQSHY